MENIEIFIKIFTFIIAVLGFCLSVYNLVYQIVKNYKNIEFQLIGIYSTSGETYIFEVNIINKSRLPISISKIDSIANGEFFSFKLDKTILKQSYHKVGDKITDRGTVYSAEFPIKLEPLEINRSFLSLNLKNIDMDISVNKEYLFHIYTSRGVIETNSTVNFIVPIYERIP